jgi:hypothetical protein
MSADPPPRVECEFDRSAGSWRLRFFNCTDETAKRHAVAHRIQQITKQLSVGRGLTNREKRELDRERRFLEREFTPEPPPSPPCDEKAARKAKAEAKKLQWLARKHDAANRLI